MNDVRAPRARLRAKIERLRTVETAPEDGAIYALSVEEAAKLFQVSRDVFDAEIKAGRIPVIYFGRTPRIPVAGLIDLIDAARERAAAYQGETTECPSSTRRGPRKTEPSPIRRASR
jgi:excisionase family DNA binding protein